MQVKFYHYIKKRKGGGANLAMLKGGGHNKICGSFTLELEVLAILKIGVCVCGGGGG